MTLTRVLKLEQPGELERHPHGYSHSPGSSRADAPPAPQPHELCHTGSLSIVLSVPEPAFPLSYLSSAGSVHIPVVCLRHAWRARRRMGARLWGVRRVAAVLWRRLTGFSELHGLIPSCREAAALFTRPPSTSSSLLLSFLS